MNYYNCIIAIGCSGMFGYEHITTNNNQTPSEEIWVNFIGKKLDLPVYNFSMPGGSNQTILRRIYFAIEFAKKQNLNPLFILQWTSLQRYETYLTDAYYKCNDWPWIRPLAELSHASNNKSLTKWAKNFYDLFDDQTLMFESIKNIDHGNLLLYKEQYGVINCLYSNWNHDEINIEHNTHFVASNSVERNNPYNVTLENKYREKNFTFNQPLMRDHETIGYISHSKDKIKYEAFNNILWNSIENYPWWHYNKNPFTHGLLDFTLENNLPIGPLGHPLELANRLIADYAWGNDQFQHLLNNRV